MVPGSNPVWLHAKLAPYQLYYIALALNLFFSCNLFSSPACFIEELKSWCFDHTKGINTCPRFPQHCERHIQSLQTRVLELQQQLAVAVTADRKKDIMIEQLDKVPGDKNGMWVSLLMVAGTKD